MDIKKVGFIGTGVMGAPMVGHLLKSGYDVNVFTRTKERANGVIEQGAKWCDSPRECAEGCDVVISIVGYPDDVRDVWTNRSTGAFKGMKKGAYGIDMTTSSPELASELFQRGKALGFNMVDCPVTGGDIGARNATLAMLFGGEQESYDALKEFLKVFGERVEYFGNAGKGQLAKACNQIAVAATMFSASEAIAFASQMGLDVEKVIDTLSAGAAGSFSLRCYGPRILSGDYKPGFKIAHLLKDIEIALKVCDSHGINLPCLELAKKAYTVLKNIGHGDKGTQALYLFYCSSLMPDLDATDKNK